jgi:hypothetical protein
MCLDVFCELTRLELCLDALALPWLDLGLDVLALSWLDLNALSKVVA